MQAWERLAISAMEDNHFQGLSTLLNTLLCSEFYKYDIFVLPNKSSWDTANHATANRLKNRKEIPINNVK